MSDVDVTNLRKLIHEAITQWAAGTSPDVASPANELTEVKDEVPKRTLPEGQRAVRTKSSGDRVYLLDDTKKTRSWITNPEVLKALGFESADVVEVDDKEMMSYQMSAAIYKAPNA